ncbi:MAG: 50S ribosomal protein L4 [Candidatus Aenigmarchaeota archaeon]|nr:50S ribosomal protein L4 [Candidatus Aenigmarchaeota archaeon]
MKTNIISIDGKKGSQVELPLQFLEAYRPDLIKRAVIVAQSKDRQPYGADPRAGLKTSAHHIARRSCYGSLANRGIARMKRITIGTGPLAGTGRVAPHAIKGRKAHAPKSEKIYKTDINNTERRFAIRSAIAATADKDIVSGRGHKTDGITEFPIVCEDALESVTKTQDAFEILESIGLSADLERTSERKVRAGRGTMRGRNYRIKKGPLIVVGNNKGINNAASNIVGVDVIEVKDLSAEMLAPGTHAGRLTVWTKSALDMLEKEKLFM